MPQGSSILTVGSALNRAEQDQARVEVLVQGQWIAGYVQGVDSHGAVLAGEGSEISVVKLELVAAVRMSDPNLVP